MGIWIWMSICSLSFPTIMLVAGYAFGKGYPQNRNALVGYRSPMSMKNADTWRFAHGVAGRFWWKWGWPCLGLSLVGMLCVWGKTENTVAFVGLGIMCAMTVPIFGVFAHTERALHKEFDQDGRRRSDQQSAESGNAES